MRSIKPPTPAPAQPPQTAVQYLAVSINGVTFHLPLYS